MDTKTVVLTDEELEIARKVASARYVCNRAEGTANARVGGQSDFATDYAGVCGEMAFCKIHNVYPDFVISVGGKGFDCLVEGVRVDVKTTQYKSGVLLSRSDKEYERTDAYALMVGDPGTGQFRFAGWAWSEELRRPENVDNERFHGAYALPQTALHVDPIRIAARLDKR